MSWLIRSYFISGIFGLSAGWLFDWWVGWLVGYVDHSIHVIIDCFSESGRSFCCCVFLIDYAAGYHPSKYSFQRMTYDI